MKVNWGTLIAVLLAGMISARSRPAQADIHALVIGPPAGSAWEPIAELTDEFEAEILDSSKWNDHNPEWKGRQPGLFSKHNVTVGNGMLHLTARAENRNDFPEGYHTFTTAAVKSKTQVLYGYFEIKARPMKSRASSAFWFYHSTPELWTEIDVFELCGEKEWTSRVPMNAHVFRTPSDPNHYDHPAEWKAPFDLTCDFHVYSLQWDAEKITWYVDGQPVRTMQNTHWHQPLYLNFDSEIMTDWFGVPDKESLPSVFSIEYVRAWRKSGSTDNR